MTKWKQGKEGKTDATRRGWWTNGQRSSTAAAERAAERSAMQLSAAARTMQPNAARRPREKVREARGKVDEDARQLAGCDWVREVW